jgi:hypothetical protein
MEHPERSSEMQTSAVRVGRMGKLYNNLRQNDAGQHRSLHRVVE